MGSEKEPGAEEFGRWLRTRREELRMSRRDVAHASGLSYPYVSQLETGYRLPSHKSVAMLASALQLDPSELSAVIPYNELATGQSPAFAAARPAAWRANPAYAASTPPLPTPPSAAQEAVAEGAVPGRAVPARAVPDPAGGVAAEIAGLVAALPREDRLDALSRAQRQVMERLVAEEVDESRSSPAEGQRPGPT